MGTTILAFLAVLVIIAVVGNHANCEMMVKAISNVSNSQVQGILANYVQLKC